MNWQIGIARRVITPKTAVWLAGYGIRRVPDGKIHDLWVKVLAFKDVGGKRAVMVTSDHMGISKTIYESLYARLQQRFCLDRAELMLAFSHNHSGPILKDVLMDYYPLDDQQRQLVAEYSAWMEGQVVDAVDEALANLQPANIFKGEGKCTFAFNRRENIETDVPQLLAEGKPLGGVVDHYVPVLAVRGEDDNLLGVLFGYACHPLTPPLNTAWCGAYPGFAQMELEEKHPGMAAMFFNTCGADQNPVKIELAERYGKMLADAVEDVLARPMRPVLSGLKTAFEFVDLAYDEIATRKTLLPVADGDSKLHYDEEIAGAVHARWVKQMLNDEIVRAVHTRWAKRMLKLMDDGVVFPISYPYPVQAWRLGKELLLISLGGEAVVDYSLRFKREFGLTTWVCGYANDLVAYIPSRRVWEEGGYEGGPHLDEYGRPAWRWAGDVEDRIVGAVHRVVAAVTSQ